MLLSSRLLTAIQSLWTLFLADGVQASFIIDQISYLYTYLHYERQGAGPISPVISSPLSWGQFQQMPEEECLPAYKEQIMPWLRDLWGRMGEERTIECRINKGKTLKSAMTLLELLFAPDQQSIHAEVYNSLVERAEAESASYAHHGGSYFTPVHIANLMANLVQPRAGETIADLSCGSGRLLWSAYNYILQTLTAPAPLAFGPDGRPLALSTAELSSVRQRLLQSTCLIGCDSNPSATLQARTLLRCLDLANTRVYTVDALSQELNQRVLSGKREGVFDVVIGNPPWGNKIDTTTLSDTLRPLHTAKPEVLFVELALQLLRPGGRCVLIVPEGLLFNSEKACVALRQRLLDENRLHAVISLPAGVFQPFAGVKTSILLFSKGGSTKHPIWCYQLSADGRSLDRKRRVQLEHNDIPDLLIKYHIRVMQPVGGWLRETQALAYCQHSSFLQDEDVQLQWENIPPKHYPYHYAIPWYVDENCFECNGESRTFPVFRRSRAIPSATRKDWEVSRMDLAAGDILTIERYKPDQLGESQRS